MVFTLYRGYLQGEKSRIHYDATLVDIINPILWPCAPRHICLGEVNQLSLTVVGNERGQKLIATSSPWSPNTASVALVATTIDAGRMVRAFESARKKLYFE